MLLDFDKKLKVLPIQFFRSPNGGTFKQGANEMIISSKNAAEVLLAIFSAASNGGATPREICQKFHPQTQPKIKLILQNLVVQKLLIPLENNKIMILGVNYISKQLVSTLKASGVENLSIVDHPHLRNQDFFDKSNRFIEKNWSPGGFLPQAWEENIDANQLDILVVTSDNEELKIFSQWNSYCLKNNKMFFPVWISNLIGYVGPIVVPSQTACFGCFQSRLNSHIEKSEKFDIPIPLLRAENVFGFHPSMGGILGDLAAFELNRFQGSAIPSSNIGAVSQFNFFDYEIKRNKVLKVPRCQTCSPMTQRASVDLEKTAFVPLDWGQPW